MSGAPAVSLASLDGVIAPVTETLIPVTDAGLVRGDGIFEVIRVYDGRPFKLEEHLDRLERSGQGIRLAVDREAVGADVEALLAAACGPVSPGGSAPPSPDRPADQTVRVMLTRGGRRIVMTEPLGATPPVARLKTITYSPTLVLDGIKSLSYAANMLTRRLAQEAGYDEALLVTPGGMVLEAPTSSVFWVRDGVLHTPPIADHILASITRGLIFELAGAAELAGGAVVERSADIDELLAADEVFLASTLREVQPVSAIDDTVFHTPGPVSERVSAAVGAYIAEWRGAAGA